MGGGGLGAPATAVAQVLSASLGLQSLGLTPADTPPAACANCAPCTAATNDSTQPIRPFKADMSKPAPASHRS
jgi:hypothetical protein